MQLAREKSKDSSVRREKDIFLLGNCNHALDKIKRTRLPKRELNIQLTENERSHQIPGYINIHILPSPTKV